MTYELGREWVRNGHQVTVLTSDQLDAQRRCRSLEEVLEGVGIRRFRSSSDWWARRYPFLCFRPIGLREAIRAQAAHVDVVHVTEARGTHNRWVAQASRAQGVPFVWSAYGGLADGTGIRRAYRAVHDRVFNTGAVVRRAAALVAQTSHEASVYQSFGAERGRIRRIPLAVDWTAFETLPARGAFRKELGISDGEQLVTFVGRIHETKGLRTLILAFSEVALVLSAARLAIVGWDHGFANAARRLVGELHLEERVRFVDARLGESRIQVYRDSDLFVLTPSVYEETSLASIEACACGTPCLVTDRCEIPGLDEAGAGATVTSDPSAIASTVISLLVGTAARSMGSRARALVRKSFTITAVAALHVRLFDEVCAEALSSPCAPTRDARPSLASS
jgi:glycosyltransferase involved in cell wall biosynthesis